MNPLSHNEIKKRILLDFPNDYAKTSDEIRAIMPDVTEEQIAYWEQTKALEYITIDNKKYYFRRAARNVFRIDPKARAFYFDRYGDDKAGRTRFLAKHIPNVLKNKNICEFDFSFTLTVKPDAIPDGETIRCWLPQPIECKYQSFTPLQTADNGNRQPIHSSLYLEKKAVRGKPTLFETSFRFSTQSFYSPTDANSAESFAPDNLNEHPPHIVFSEKISEVSARIVGKEKDKKEIAKKIFTWISDNIVWAAAREYSTIANIPEYVLGHRHGDCGQVTLLFMTLCRYNGIPARWLSGFMLHPGYENLHDWCEIFIDKSGWLPVDVSFGVQRFGDNEQVRYFYFTGMDAYRLVVNRGISGELSPEKLFPRSETVDFQRGEVEWRGGNIYFDQFDYKFTVKQIEG